ncbi:hypothetical protein ACI2L4_35125 [Streptomyces sparsogenes]|uniref:hypothetical protein n=1 Tax=Streptomyces sparsogenes TaxID=67365 RepID=UPI0034021436
MAAVLELVRRREPAPAAGGSDDRVQLLRAEAQVAGVVAAEAILSLGVAFHCAVANDHNQITASINRLRTLTQGGAHAYYIDIAHFMADQPLAEPSTARWLDGAEPTRRRWRALVTARRDLVLQPPRG